MYYKKKETYSFIMPKEYYAYLAFKEKLRDADILFLDEGGARMQTIMVTVSARIEVDNDGNFVN